MIALTLQHQGEEEEENKGSGSVGEDSSVTMGKSITYLLLLLLLLKGGRRIDEVLIGNNGHLYQQPYHTVLLRCVISSRVYLPTQSSVCECPLCSMDA